MRRPYSVHLVSVRTVPLAVAFATLVLAAPAVGAQEATKVGVVDLDRVLVESEAGRALQARLEEFSAGVQREDASRTQRAVDIRQQITDGASTLSEEKLSELRSEFETLTAAIQQFRAEKQREGEEMRQQGLREIELQLQPIFERLRDEGDYDLILNYAAGVVLVRSDRVDLTAQVLEQLKSVPAE